MHKDVPCSRTVFDLAEQVLQVVELAVNVSDEDDSRGSVHRWDVERGPLFVMVEVRLLQEEGLGSDAGERDVEEEKGEDGEGGHGADCKAGRLASCVAHGRYK